MSQALSDAAIGARVRDARLAKGLSLSALAEATGLHRAMLGRVEQGDSPLDVPAGARVAAALDVPVAALLLGPDPGPRTLRAVPVAPGRWTSDTPADEALWATIAGGCPVPLAELVDLARQHGVAVLFLPGPMRGEDGPAGAWGVGVAPETR